MKNIKRVRAIVFGSLLLGAVSPFAFAQDIGSRSEFERYEQAKIAVTYEGEVGSLLQQLAERLNVGYMSYNIDSSRPVILKGNGTQTFKGLIDAINQQLVDSNIRFTELGNRTFLVLSSGSEEITGVKPKSNQYIGQVVFAEPELVKNRIELVGLDEEEGQGGEETVPVTPVAPQTNEAAKAETAKVEAAKVETVAVNAALQGMETSPIGEAVASTATATEAVVEGSTDAEVGDAVAGQVPVGKVEALVLEPKQEKQMNLLNDIVMESTDPKVLAQYKSKKAPSYQISSKVRLGLTDIKVTPLSTFLIFEEGADTSVLVLKGKYEKLAQFGNYIGILHKKNRAPAQIEINNAKGEKLVLKRR
ncbi:hypothetical protein [Testudinibacter sp. TR-2022]|nr:hypothetical protein [Testudinibacter sp. TR-2022]TNH25553.1 hypothetical protein FHQ29_01420 [Testudinibacter sp. TR-2022]